VQNREWPAYTNGAEKPSLTTDYGCSFHLLGACSELARWLAEQAEQEGVEVITNCAASEVLSDGYGSVLGVRTRDMGVAKDGNHKDTYMLGAQVNARITMFAEGCRGSLSEVRLWSQPPRSCTAIEAFSLPDTSLQRCLLMARGIPC
jgi:flavin-dependent dehydrogenase